MKRSAAIWSLALCLLALAPAIASADQCDSTYAQNMARQGYQYLSAQRWQDARVAAGQLALYARGCSDPKVGYPSVVYSAYIGSVALHGLGNDAEASQAAQAGMTVLGLLKKDGGYASLVSAMEPKFEDLARELKVQPVTAQNAASAQAPAQASGSIVH